MKVMKMKGSINNSTTPQIITRFRTWPLLIRIGEIYRSMSAVLIQEIFSRLRNFLKSQLRRRKIKKLKTQKTLVQTFKLPENLVRCLKEPNQISTRSRENPQVLCQCNTLPTNRLRAHLQRVKTQMIQT